MDKDPYNKKIPWKMKMKKKKPENSIIKILKDY